jgi:hypothetical protein
MIGHPRKITKENLEEWKNLRDQTRMELEDARKMLPTLINPREKVIMKQIIKVLEHSLNARGSGLEDMYEDLEERYRKQQIKTKLWDKIKCCCGK